MGVVGRATVDVKFHESIAGKSCDKLVNLVKQPELPGVGFGSSPVGDYMKVYQRLCAVCDPGSYLCPLERHKLDEHSRTVPWNFLIEEFHVVVPQVDVLDCPGIQLVIHIRVVRPFIILSGAIDAQRLKTGLQFAV